MDINSQMISHRKLSVIGSQTCKPQRWYRRQFWEYDQTSTSDAWRWAKVTTTKTFLQTSQVPVWCTFREFIHSLSRAPYINIEFLDGTWQCREPILTVFQFRDHILERTWPAKAVVWSMGNFLFMLYIWYIWYMYDIYLLYIWLRLSFCCYLCNQH